MAKQSKLQEDIENVIKKQSKQSKFGSRRLQFKTPTQKSNFSDAKII
jgi:hypothetical protein